MLKPKNAHTYLFQSKQSMLEHVAGDKNPRRNILSGVNELCNKRIKR